MAYARIQPLQEVLIYLHDPCEPIQAKALDITLRGPMAELKNAKGSQAAHPQLR